MFHYAFTAESDSERILKIGQHFVKLWAIKYWFVFYETLCRDNQRSRMKKSVKDQHLA